MAKRLYTQTTVVIITALLTLAVGVGTSDADRWAQAQSATHGISSVRPDDRAGIRIGGAPTPVSYPDAFERAVAAHLASVKAPADASRGGFPWASVGLGAATLALVAAIVARGVPAFRRLRERAA